MNFEGRILLELRTPFAYLRDLTDEIHNVNRREGNRPQMKIGGDISADPQPICSHCLQVSWGTWIRTKINRFRACGSAVELSPTIEVGTYYHADPLISRVD